MGACLEPTPPMGHYRVEVRTESAYINSNLGEFNAWWTGGRADAPRRTIHANPTGPNGFVVPVEDVAHLLAAVTQVIGHPVYARWWGHTEPSAHIPAEQWGWDITGDMARIVGPVSPPHAATGPIGTVEIGYDAMAGLRVMLAVLVNRVAAPRVGADLDAYSPHGSLTTHVKVVAAQLGLDLDVTSPSPVTGPVVADLADTLGPLIAGPDVDHDGLLLLAAGLQTLAEIAAQEAHRLDDLARAHAAADQ